MSVIDCGIHFNSSKNGEDVHGEHLKPTTAFKVICSKGCKTCLHQAAKSPKT